MTVERIKGAVKRSKRSLRPRIMALILVVLLPICLSLIVLSSTVLVRFAQLSRDRSRHELVLNMDRVARDIENVENYADEFAASYITEINSASGILGAMTPFDMIDDLGSWFSHLDLPGFVYLYDIGGDRAYVKYYGSAVPSGDRGKLTASVERFAAAAGSRDFELHSVGGRDFVCRTYAYRSCGIGFLIDAAEVVYDAFAPTWDERGALYIRTTTGAAQIYADGTVESTMRSYGDLSRASIAEESIEWSSERTGLAVCVRYARLNALPEIPVFEWVLFALSLVCLLLLPLVWNVLRIEVLEPVDILTRALNELGDGNEDYRIDVADERYSDEILMLFRAFDQSAGEQKLSHERQLQLVRTELDNLRLQVNPHMLLNSYNLIFALAQSRDYQRIQDYTYLLVRYFRYVLRKNDDFVPLSQEIDFIANYVEIQSIRHPGAFHYSCKVQPPCERALIPPLLVENFVENSMKHALSPGRTVEILMDIKREGDRVLIAVSDTGNGIAPEILEKLQNGEPYVDPAGNRHIGIWNSMRRVELFYGEKASFEIVSAPEEGTSMILKIPYREAEEQ